MLGKLMSLLEPSALRCIYCVGAIQKIASQVDH